MLVETKMIDFNARRLRFFRRGSLWCPSAWSPSCSVVVLLRFVLVPFPSILRAAGLW